MRIPDTINTPIPAPAVGNPVWVGNTAPADPKIGKAWMDTSTTPNSLKVYDGGKWVAASSGGAAGNFLPLAGGQMDLNAVVDFNAGAIINVDIDNGRY